MVRIWLARTAPSRARDAITGPTGNARTPVASGRLPILVECSPSTRRERSTAQWTAGRPHGDGEHQDISHLDPHSRRYSLERGCECHCDYVSGYPRVRLIGYSR